jgi:hypothetical protein
MSKRRKNKELEWYFEIPAYKQVKFSETLLASLFYIAMCSLLWFYDKELFFFSFWALFWLPVTGIFVAWLTLALQSNRQIYFRIDSFGIYSEVHTSLAYPIAFMSFLWRLLLSVFNDERPLPNSNFSSSRFLEWKDVKGVQANELWNRIIVKGGLSGNMVLWSSDSVYSDACAIIDYYLDDRM